MTDIHTHILPAMDDGAKTPEISVAMLAMEARQGVDAVVLTPHFYRNRESGRSFLSRREASMQALQQALAELEPRQRAGLPRLALGAEVAWIPHLADCEGLSRMCLGSSNRILLELPFYPWSDQMISQLYEFQGRTGLVPVIAHLERYLDGQHPEHIDAVLSLGVTVQFSAEPLLHWSQRGQVLKLLKAGHGHLVASDAHNLKSRCPNLGMAMGIVRKKLGDQKEKYLQDCGDRIFSAASPQE